MECKDINDCGIWPRYLASRNRRILLSGKPQPGYRESSDRSNAVVIRLTGLQIRTFPSHPTTSNSQNNKAIMVDETSR